MDSPSSAASTTPRSLQGRPRMSPWAAERDASGDTVVEAVLLGIPQKNAIEWGTYGKRVTKPVDIGVCPYLSDLVEWFGGSYFSYSHLHNLQEELTYLIG